MRLTKSGQPIAAATPRGLQFGLALCLLGTSLLASAQSAAAPQIYSCVDANGKKLTSDRPIAECNARDQRVLNPDGSVHGVLRPPMTADERSAEEAREHDAAVARAGKQEAIRRDRNLLARFPNEAAHQKARNAALDDVRKSIRQSQARLADLAAERKPLKDEAEFYVGRQLPVKLKTQLDANDASTDALRSLLQNQQHEAVRIDALYDAELERLRKLWAGSQPGSLGVLAGGGASAPRR